MRRWQKVQLPRWNRFSSYRKPISNHLAMKGKYRAVCRKPDAEGSNPENHNLLLNTGYRQKDLSI